METPGDVIQAVTPKILMKLTQICKEIDVHWNFHGRKPLVSLQ